MNSPDANDRLVYCDLCCATPTNELKWNEFAGVATYDAPLSGGRWAYVCKRHEYLAYLGLGRRVNAAYWRAKED